MIFLEAFKVSMTFFDSLFFFFFVGLFIYSWGRARGDSPQVEQRISI